MEAIGQIHTFTIAGTKMIRKYVHKSELYECTMKCERKHNICNSNTLLNKAPLTL